MSIAGAGPVYELTSWAYQQLAANQIIKSMFGATARISDDVQENPSFPYISFGDTQEIGDFADGIDGSEIYFSLDVWDRSGGSDAASAGVNAISLVLNRSDDAPVTLDNYRLLVMQRHNSNILKDPDGITWRGMIVFRALVEPR